jgi:DNA-binding MarR family transcriptional regulator/GNAT superfamily N-acetyltransferase
MSSTENSKAIVDEVFAIREFNRFYTARLGLLRRRYLDGEFSLTEARTLYEIDANPNLTAAGLREKLRLDKGYLSRLLALLTKRKLISQKASLPDGRKRLLTLSALGRAKLAGLNEQSAQQIEHLLQPLNPGERKAVAGALWQARSLLSREHVDNVRIIRLTKVKQDALVLLQEYFEDINVTQRDSPKAIRQVINAPSSAMWVAYLREEAVGCVVLRRLEGFPRSGECKRLYVRRQARGRGIANAMLSALEAYAQVQELQWIYLDSKDDLEAALALYRKRGYVPCERYNDNPQANVFLRKRIQPPGEAPPG